MFKKHSDVHVRIMAEIRDVEKCVLVFESFMTAATTEGTKPEVLRALCENVKAAESVADTSLRTMIDSLSQTPYLPSTREDLISIATSCDKIANKCETVSKMIVLQGITFPSVYMQDVQQIFVTTQKQFVVLEKCISMLFSQMQVLAKNPEHLDEIRALESEVDTIEDRISESVFAADMELAAKMQIAQVVEMLCDLSDIIEDIADKIQIMLITRKA